MASIPVPYPGRAVEALQEGVPHRGPIKTATCLKQAGAQIEIPKSPKPRARIQPRAPRFFLPAISWKSQVFLGKAQCPAGSASLFVGEPGARRMSWKRQVTGKEPSLGPFGSFQNIWSPFLGAPIVRITACLWKPPFHLINSWQEPMSYVVTGDGC